MAKIFLSSVALVLVAAATAQQSIFSCSNPGNICANGGNCDFGAGTCDCAAGWEGESCQVQTSRRCTSLPCNNEGLCELDASNTPVCRCNAGFSGESCEISPMTCACTSTSMTVRMLPPGDFSNGQGFVHEGNTNPTPRNPLCETNKDAATGVHSLTLSHDSTPCGVSPKTNVQSNGDYTHDRTFHFRYSMLSTKHNIAFRCQCVFSSTDQFLYATIGNVDGSDLSNLIQRVATSEIYPVSFTLFTNGQQVVASTQLIIGQDLDLTIVADAGFCTMVDSIVVNNTLVGADSLDATLLEGGCRTDLGRTVLETELVASSTFNEWSVRMGAFLLDGSNSISIAIGFRAYPTGSASCFTPTCTTSGRKKREAIGNTETVPETTGSFNPILYIQFPGQNTAPQQSDSDDEVPISSNVMIALIVMSAVIVVLLVVCLTVGLTLVLRRRKANRQQPPEYKH